MVYFDLWPEPSCRMQYMLESFARLVDVVVVSAMLRYFKRNVFRLVGLWKKFLRADTDKLRVQTVWMNDKLRVRIMWHLFQFDFMNAVREVRLHSNPRGESVYLQRILTHSPNGYFNQDEKRFARSLLS